MINILVIDDLGTPSLTTTKPVYTNYVSKCEANILIITSKGGLSSHDKLNALASMELNSPSTDGTVELIAQAWHHEYTIHQIFTRQEDLLLRVASLRQLLHIDHGSSFQSIMAFRDKGIMKDILCKQNIPILAYKRLYTPSDLLMFAEFMSYPLIIKPTLGSASVGIRILQSRTDMGHYLRTDYLSSQLSDHSGKFDCTGDLIVETMLPRHTSMYHVNGLLRNGQLIAIYPFAYISTNLNFTHGKPYGNVALLPTDSIYNDLLTATKLVLNAYHKDGYLNDVTTFHAEFFAVYPSDNHINHHHILNLPPSFSNPNHNNKPCFVLCEIAARRPGGSIVQLMNGMQLNHCLPFVQSEFRLAAGLTIPNIHLHTNIRTADYLIPHKPMSVLTHMPDSLTFPLCDVIKYIPTLTYPNSIPYTNFSVGTLNTIARFTYQGKLSLDETIHLLDNAKNWFNNNVGYISISSTTRTTKKNPSSFSSVVSTSSYHSKPAIRFARIGKQRYMNQYEKSLRMIHIHKNGQLGHKVSRRLVLNVQKRALQRYNASMSMIKYQRRPHISLRLIQKLYPKSSSSYINDHEQQQQQQQHLCGPVILSLRTPGIGLVRRIHHHHQQQQQQVKNHHHLFTNKMNNHHYRLESEARINARIKYGRELIRKSSDRKTIGTTLLSKVQRISGNAGGQGDWWMGGKRPVVVSIKRTISSAAK